MDKFFAYLYAELYNIQVNAIKDNEQDRIDINSMFKMNTIEKCLLSINISLSDIQEEIKKVKCNCNE